MNKRPLGKTGQQISEIGFGCGNVGGLMIRAEPGERVRAAAHAIERGITYFDTAAQYGDGESERNLGRVLAELRPDVLVGTKLRLDADDVDGGHERIAQHLTASLDRLDRDSVDILYYHGRIRNPGPNGPGRGATREARGLGRSPSSISRGATREARGLGRSPSSISRGGGLTAEQVLGPLLDSFRRFRDQGRVRFLAFTGLGDTDAVLEVIRAGAFDVFHCYFSAVNPSAGFAVPSDFAPQDMQRMIDRAVESGMSALAIRILAAGALGGEDERHPLAGGTGGTLISGTDYDADFRRAEQLRPVAAELGASLPELAIRFALSKPGIASALVGFSSLEQIDVACSAAEAGPLGEDVVQRIVNEATKA
jgi:aryl-alcohol dehydrogenase-like predicted oxidoreductase